MYKKHWSLAEKPFVNTPDPRFMYHSHRHEEALTRFLYVVTEGKGAMLLTGDYGCGKTLLTRVFLSGLDTERYDVALVTHPNLSPTDFLREIMYQFGYETKDLTKVDLLHMLDKHLMRNRCKEMRTIVVVDEAQLVDDPLTLEEIRLLLNFQQNDSFNISLMLVGQPELRDRVIEFPQLRQRLSVRFHLGPLSEADTVGYIAKRLSIASATHEIFTEDAVAAVFEASCGVPRDINNICDLALLIGYGRRVNIVDREVIAQVVQDLDLG